MVLDFHYPLIYVWTIIPLYAYRTYTVALFMLSLLLRNKIRGKEGLLENDKYLNFLFNAPPVGFSFLINGKKPFPFLKPFKRDCQM